MILEVYANHNQLLLNCCTQLLCHLKPPFVVDRILNRGRPTLDPSQVFALNSNIYIYISTNARALRSMVPDYAL